MATARSQFQEEVLKLQHQIGAGTNDKDNPGPVLRERKNVSEEYTIDKIEQKDLKQVNGKWSPRYLLRWEGCGMGSDEWYDLDDLRGAMDAVKEYRRESPSIPLYSTQERRQAPRNSSLIGTCGPAQRLRRCLR
jgi:hypothetical protein